jgi:hypothetical protein
MVDVVSWTEVAVLKQKTLFNNRSQKKTGGAPFAGDGSGIPPFSVDLKKLST